MSEYAQGGCGFPIPWYCETVEEIMDDIEETLCWQCSKTYPIEAEKCPYCGAANGNVDMKKAAIEAMKTHNPPDPLRKCKHGRVYDGTTCPQCRDESQAPTLEPVDGDWCNTSLENWFPYSAEELERLRTENANLARALAKEVNGETFMGEPVIRPVRRSYYQAAEPVAVVNHVVSAELDLPIGMKLYTAPPAERGEPIAWVVAVEEQGRMKVYGPQYNWRGHAEQDAELPRKRGQKAEVWACYPTAAPTFKSCDAAGDWHERKDQAFTANNTECTECPSGDCSDCPRKTPRWYP